MQYTENVLIVKMKIFTGKILIFFLFLLNIDCGYTLEPPRRGGSNVYPQSMFWSKNVCYKKWGSKGYALHGHVFVMTMVNYISIAMWSNGPCKNVWHNSSAEV